MHLRAAEMRAYSSMQRTLLNAKTRLHRGRQGEKPDRSTRENETLALLGRFPALPVSALAHGRRQCGGAEAQSTEFLPVALPAVILAPRHLRRVAGQVLAADLRQCCPTAPGAGGQRSSLPDWCRRRLRRRRPGG